MFRLIRIVTILLVLDSTGIGDALSALPAVTSLAAKHEVTVYARKYYRSFWERAGVTFLQAAGQTANPNFLARYDKVYFLEEWSSRSENLVGYLPAPRMEQFAALVGATLPDSFSWEEYLLPAKTDGEPYMVFTGSAIEGYRSLPAEAEESLYSALAARGSTIRLPRVYIYASYIQPQGAGFVAGDLDKLISLVYNARAVVAVEGGVLNIACALNVPSVGIYGVTGPEVTEQYRKYLPDLRHESVRGTGHSTCRMPCYRHVTNGFAVCENRNAAYCMEHVNNTEVLTALENML
jgi:ADP-heptose:LPS heptosyltransferase